MTKNAIDRQNRCNVDNNDDIDDNDDEEDDDEDNNKTNNNNKSNIITKTTNRIRVCFYVSPQQLNEPNEEQTKTFGPIWRPIHIQNILQFFSFLVKNTQFRKSEYLNKENFKYLIKLLNNC